MIEFRLLGRFVVLHAGREIPAADFGGRKVRALLRVLATRRGVLVTHDALTEMLWGERPPADPVANLGVLVHRARTALGEPSLLVTGAGGYALAGGEVCRVDAEEFLTAIARCRPLAGRSALAGYRAALARWVGEPLVEDSYDDWAVAYRRRLSAARQEGLERASELAIDVGDADVAVELAAAAVAAEPLRERSALTLVRALAAAGDPVAALERYDDYRRVLADQLGLDPSAEATAVQALLLRGELRATPASRTEVPAALDELVFVGRQRELAEAVDCLRHAPLPVVIIAGHSGVGKSRLLREIAGELPALPAQAFPAERAEPWSLARTLLRETLANDALAADALPPAVRSALSTVLPELAAERDRLDPESRRALVLEGAVRLLGALPDAVILIDDAQWADPSSVLVLDAVLARTPRRPIVLAYRPEELRPGPVADLLRGHSDAVTIELTGLSVEAITDLVRTPALADALVEHTDRSPLAILEVLRALAAEGAVSRDSRGQWGGRTRDAPGRAAEIAAAGQRRAIERQADRHDDLARLVLALLALLGVEASARTLAAAAATAERDVLDSLGRLSAAGLVRLGNAGWATAHDMVAEVIAARLPAAERGRLHGLLAYALVATGAETRDVARHWHAAGDVHTAATAYADAAHHALRNFADREAADLAEAGLGLRVPADVRGRLLDARSQARTRLGDLVGARADLTEALTAQPAGPGRARLLARLASLASGSDDLVRANELAELALVEAGLDPQARAGALEIGAVLDMNLARPERAVVRGDAALALYEQLGDARGRARILDARAMATFLRGDITAAVSAFHQAAHIFEDSGDLVRLVTPRSTRGHALVFAGRPLEGLTDSSSALETARSLGQPEGQAYALWHRAEALCALGHADEASADAAEALAIARGIGHRGWTATSWRAVGVAAQMRGDLESALHAFTRSLEFSEHLHLFASWAAARCASVQVARGGLVAATSLAERALREGPPLAHFEARQARLEVAVAAGEEQAGALAAVAHRLALSAGYHAGIDRLAELSVR